MTGDRECSIFLSIFKFVKCTRFPIDKGSSKRKFSVKINSCKFWQLKIKKIKTKTKLY